MGRSHAPASPHVRTDVDAGVDASAGGISLIDHLIADHLDARDIPEDPGMNGDPDEHAIVTRAGSDGIVGDDRVLAPEKDNPHVRRIPDDVARDEVPWPRKRDAV